MRGDEPTSSRDLTPQRGMRKGTRSCYECRKRKVRCIFAPESSTCQNCKTKNKICTEQRRELLHTSGIETKDSLRKRIAQLEALLEASRIGNGITDDDNDIVTTPLGQSTGSSLAIVGTDSSTPLARSNSNDMSISSRQPSSATPPSSLSPIATKSKTSPQVSVDKHSPQSIDPIVTLFDNAIVRTSDSIWPMPTTNTRNSSNDVV